MFDNYIFWAPDNIDNATLIYVNDAVGNIALLYDSYKEIGQVNILKKKYNSLCDG